MEYEDEGSLAYYTRLGLPQNVARSLVQLRRDQSQGSISYAQEGIYRRGSQEEGGQSRQ